MNRSGAASVHDKSNRTDLYAKYRALKLAADATHDEQQLDRITDRLYDVRFQILDKPIRSVAEINTKLEIAHFHEVNLDVSRYLAQLNAQVGMFAAAA